MVAPAQTSPHLLQLLVVPSGVLQPSSGAPHLAQFAAHCEVHTPLPQVGEPTTLVVPHVWLQPPQFVTSLATVRSQPLRGLPSQSSHRPTHLGVQALASLLEWYLTRRGPGGTASTLTGHPVTWKYRGQVVPTDGRVTVELDITGYGSDEHQRRARESGVDHYQTKPVDLDELLALLARPAVHTT